MNIIQRNPLIKAVLKSTSDWILPNTSLSENYKLTDNLTVSRLWIFLTISTTIHPGKHTILSRLHDRPLLNPSGPALQAAVIMSVDNEDKSHRNLFTFFRNLKNNTPNLNHSSKQPTWPPTPTCSLYSFLPLHSQSLLMMIASLLLLISHNDICVSGHLYFCVTGLERTFWIHVLSISFHSRLRSNTPPLGYIFLDIYVYNFTALLHHTLLSLLSIYAYRIIF